MNGIKKSLIMLAVISLCSGDTSADYLQVQWEINLLDQAHPQSMDTSMLLTLFDQNPKGSYIG